MKNDNRAIRLTEVAPRPAQSRLILIASCFGTVIEWYDFFIYAFIAPLVFNGLFFPQFDPKIGTIAVFATFAVGFVARPLGGIVFGHFGDRIGRKSILLVTLIMMGLATMAIGALPSYASIGIAAPILLSLLRFLQGFALGGESVGPLLMTVEGSPQGRRSLFGGLLQAAAPFGVVLASLATTLIARLPNADLLSWGWRVPFLLSVVLILLGSFVRSRVRETPAFTGVRSHAAAARIPLVTVLTRFKLPVLITMLIVMAETSYFYVTAVFSISYGIRELGIARTLMTDAVLVASLVAMVVVPLSGSVSDRVGRRPVLITGLLAMGAFAWPFFWLLGTASPMLVLAAVVAVNGVLHPIVFGPEGAFTAELFDTHIRFTGVSVGKQMGTVLGGGLAPLVAASLLAWSPGSVAPIIAYLVTLVVLAIAAVARAPETRGADVTGAVPR